jgi:hypothetical protein
MGGGYFSGGWYSSDLRLEPPPHSSPGLPEEEVNPTSPKELADPIAQWNLPALCRTPRRGNILPWEPQPPGGSSPPHPSWRHY